MKLLRIFISTMFVLGASLSTFAANVGDPSYNNTTNMDNTGISAPTDTQFNDLNKVKPAPVEENHKMKTIHAPISSTDKIRSVQEALSAKGHNVGGSDGILGSRTSAALREFQRNNNLDVTGKINQETLDRLGLEFGAEQQNDTNTFAE